MTSRPTAEAVAAGMLAMVTSAAAGALLRTMPPFPDGPSLAAVDRWWIDMGTGAAAMTLVQLAAIVLAAWIAVAAFVDLAARLHPTVVVLGLRRLICPPMLRRLVGCIVVLTTAGPTALAGADDTVPVEIGGPGEIDPTGGPAPDDLVLVDIGPAPSTADDATAAAETLLLTDVGSVTGRGQLAPDDDTPTPLGPVEVATLADRDETWTVQRGDHLWHIADETVAERGGEASEAEVAAYWRRLIAANHDAVGADPDLIHPGQVLRLPE